MAHLKFFYFLKNCKCTLQRGTPNAWIWLCFLTCNQFCGQRCYLFI